MKLFSINKRNVSTILYIWDVSFRVIVSTDNEYEDLESLSERLLFFETPYAFYVSEKHINTYRIVQRRRQTPDKIRAPEGFIEIGIFFSSQFDRYTILPYHIRFSIILHGTRVRQRCE